ncbi:MAG: hypothetical protein PHT78_03790 [Desulfitobacteriaceae bacterium]|nr:hypothetical protein [Desulfitobacteriaceae bacterium]MDD4752366.1 hypothetical protein [Desulfitobacteriaceae bacterium]
MNFNMNDFYFILAILKLFSLIAIPGGIIYGIIALMRYLRKLSQRIDNIEKKLNSNIEK